MNDRSKLSRWGKGFFLWTVVALFYFAQSQIYLPLEAGRAVVEFRDKFWGSTLLWEFSGWYLWGLFSLVIYRLAVRFPLQKNQWLRHLPIHLLSGVIFAFAHVAIHLAILTVIDSQILNSPYALSSEFVSGFRYRFTWRIWVYFVALAVCHIIMLQKKVHEEQNRAARLETQLAQAQLEALKMQLQPHFLFNTLQSISELVHQDVDAADEMTVRLASFLRLTLESTSSRDVPLEQELEFLRCYLEIEELRFRDRLKVQMEIDPETLEARVPNLILQPIVENAIKHGIAPNEKGEIRIRTSRMDEMLRVEIRDNGAGLSPDRGLDQGVGLSNTRARLEQHYGTRQRLELQSVREGGVLVILDLPFQTGS